MECCKYWDSWILRSKNIVRKIPKVDEVHFYFILLLIMLWSWLSQARKAGWSIYLSILLGLRTYRAVMDLILKIDWCIPSWHSYWKVLYEISRGLSSSREGCQIVGRAKRKKELTRRYFWLFEDDACPMSAAAEKCGNVVKVPSQNIYVSNPKPGREATLWFGRWCEYCRWKKEILCLWGSASNRQARKHT